MDDVQDTAGLPTKDDYSGVDWGAERAQMIADGDTIGAALLDDVLARPHHQRLPVGTILDALANRRQIFKTHAALRPCIESEATTLAGACKRWRLLADWVPRFATWRDGRHAIDLGGPTGPVSSERIHPPAPDLVRSPELTWARAFRESTAALLPRAVDERLDDVAVQRLLQDLDDVLDGRAVDVSAHVREVDLQVRILLTRIVQLQANLKTDQKYKPTAQLGTPPQPPEVATQGPRGETENMPANANTLVRDGKTWRIRFGGEAHSLPDLQGLVYLQKLLASPHTEIDVFDLKGIERSEPASRQPSLDGPGIVIAKREYDDAQEQLRMAEENGDQGQAAVAKERLRLLATTVGDPRSRSATRDLPNDAERLRAAVGRALGRVLTEIQRVHPKAHKHLVEFLVSPTGYSPSYRPAEAITWQVNLAATAAATAALDQPTDEE